MPYSRTLSRWMRYVMLALVSGTFACAHVRTGTSTPALNDTSPTLVPPEPDVANERQLDFSRYETPSECERAILNIRAKLERDGTRDTLRYDPTADSIPAVAIEAGQACSAKFTVDNVAPEQLLYLMRVSLMINNDEQAQAAVDRQLSLTTDTAEQARVLFAATQAYLSAKPIRFEAAQAALLHLDSFGSAGRIGRLQAHHAMIAYLMPLFDTTGLELHADSLMAIIPTLTAKELDTWSPLIPAAYAARASVATFQRSPVEAIPVIQQGASTFGRLRGGQVRSTLQWVLQSYMAQARLYGKPATPLAGHYSYNSGDTTARPSPGKVSLLVQVAHNCGDHCYRQYALLGRLYQQYASAGLEITLVARTAGYSRNSGVQTPAEETESIRKYFLEDRNLPTALVVQESQFTTQQDGRRVNQATQYDELYGAAMAVLIDRDGVIRWSGGIDGGVEAMLNAYITKLVAVPPQQTLRLMLQQQGAEQGQSQQEQPQQEQPQQEQPQQE